MGFMKRNLAMDRTSDIPRFIKDWLLLSVLFSFLIFFINRDDGFEPFLLKMLMIAVGVMLAYVVTRFHILVEVWFFRGLLVVIALSCLWLPPYFGADEFISNGLFIGGMAFTFSCAGYKTDLVKKGHNKHSMNNV